VGVSFLGAGLVAPLAVLLAAPRDALPALPSDSDLLAYLARDDVFWRLLLTSELLQCAGTAAVLALLARSHSPLPPGVLSLSHARPAAWLPQGLAGGAASLGAVALLAALTALAGGRGGEGASSSTLISHALAGGPSGWAALTLATVLLAPAFEEAVFRGVLLATLTKWVPTPAAVALSALAFAAVHGQGLADSAQLLVMGGVAGLVYCRTRTLLAPMAVHACFNGGVLLLYAAWTAGQ
jgi:membrane protease YdiL (CAAX protease family)